MAGGQAVQFFDGDIQQRGHLVNESARTAGTGAVHPDLHAARQEQDLCILTAEFNDHIRFGDEGIRRHSGGVDLLNEVDPAHICHAHAC